jgi:hypothetical protein
MFSLIFDIIMEFRFTRWLFGALVAALIIWSGGLSTIGGWGALGFVAFLMFLPDLIERGQDK